MACPLALTELLAALPQQYPGPGGAVAVLREGQVIAQRVWGYADLERRRPMTAQTLFPVCSITKQFVCALILDVFGSPDQAQPLLDRLYPNLSALGVTVAALCHNQSGLRDTWATTVLLGAHPEGHFTKADTHRLLARQQALQFPSGTQYSYSNGNFHVLARLLEAHTGLSMGDLLRQRLFEPAGMATATYAEDTAHCPGDCVGYEGDAVLGHRPAINRIWWSGDAGMVASLTDMVAWEQGWDTHRAVATHVTQRLATPVMGPDGTPACYGHGLERSSLEGEWVVGHTGALRGFHLQRAWMPSQRLSVVTLFNHHVDWEVGERLMRAALGRTAPPLVEVETGTTATSNDWAGVYLCRDTRLTLRLTPGEATTWVAMFAGYPEVLTAVDEHTLQGAEMTLRRVGTHVLLQRPEQGLTSVCERVEGEPQDDGVGHYVCDELGSVFRCEGQELALYGAFDGALGEGPLHVMQPAGGDVWWLECPRSLDEPAPGAWTVVFERDAHGQVGGLTLGCWLARRFVFRRLHSK